MGTLIGTLGIAGVGVIGGSLGLAARAHGLAGHILGIGRNESRLRTACEMGAVDSYTTDFLKGARKCDLLYLATPVGVILEQIESLRQITDAEILVTDGGSTKAEIVELARSLPPNIRFVGGHPMAGSESSGVEAATQDLFCGAVYVLTPDASTDAAALDIVRRLAEGTGAHVAIIDPTTHDEAVALTSHLPHIIAGILVRLAARRGEDTAGLAAGSFRDLTRVAASPPEMWSDIALSNRQMVLRAASEFREALAEIEGILQHGDSEAADAWFSGSKAARESLSGRKELKP